MADSLDSGSSAHSGRAGSSPASRTDIEIHEKVEILMDFSFLEQKISGHAASAA